MRLTIVLLIAAAALAGCDRRDQKPMNTAAQQSAPRASGSVSDAGAQPQRANPGEPGQGPRADSKTKQEPPIQGQADARQPEQKKDFDSKS